MPKASPGCRFQQQFNRGTDEGFYGLGQHQNGQMNYNGEDVELAQHNMDVAIPFVVSTRNYGLLWDNNSITRFGDPKPYAYAGGAGRRTAGQWRQRLDRDLQRQRQDHRAAAGTDDRASISRRREPLAGRHAHCPTCSRPSPACTSPGTARSRRDTGGLHRFRLYGSSYFKVFVDGREVLDRWRQNWNPWYHNFDLKLAAGQPHKVRDRVGAGLRLHRAPAPRSRGPRPTAIR